MSAQSFQYQNQQAWRDLQQIMPEACHLPEDDLPTESWFAWDSEQVHVDAYRNADAPAKIILFHGVGTNGRQMQMVLGRFLAQQGFETLALDMPNYGMTNFSGCPTYDDWVAIGSAFVQAEQQDGRPVFLYGLSAGGMLAYDVAASNGRVTGVIGMTFLDQNFPVVRQETARNLMVSDLATPMMPLALRLGLGKLRLKMSWVAKMWALCNDPKGQAIFMRDESSAGNWVSLAFLHSYATAKRPIAPADFRVCPILLTQPAADVWTPLALSEPFLAQMTHVNTRTILLPHGGHYPVESEAIAQLHQAALDFIRQHLSDESVSKIRAD